MSNSSILMPGQMPVAPGTNPDEMIAAAHAA